MRSCIIDKKNGGTNFEVQLCVKDEEVQSLTIHTYPDQGPKMWRAFQRLYVGMGLRGMLTADAWHIIWLAQKESCGDISEMLNILEVTVCQNARKGPWLGNGNQGIIKEDVRFFITHTPFTNAIFEKFYPLIV